jgi:short-subunit dehydrogenase
MEFCERYGPWAVVVGASEGVGAAVARQLGQRGVSVVMIARRPGALEEVVATMTSETRTVAVDLAVDGAWSTIARATSDLEVGLLVYNAGAVAPTSFLEHDAETWHGVLNRNCSVVVDAVHHFAGPMSRRGHGGIALVGSNAGWAGTAGLAVYGATKAFQLLLAESLWAELRPRGVDVLAMVLGLTDTPAVRRMLGGRPLGDGAADSDDVARALLDGLADGPTIPPGPSPYGDVDRRAAVEVRTARTAGHFGG